MLKAGTELTTADKMEHLLIRLGYKRGEHKVEPGLYSLGDPTDMSPVFVTANYKLSFDALRTGLKGMDAYILVLDTKGINVWCAAGKGTFGTEELVARITSSRLEEIVRHRELILPQLGAPGIAAHEVKRRTGFNVIYGPVRASDIKTFMEGGKKADEKMRTVTFPMKERLVLIPVELKNFFIYALAFCILGYLTAGPFGLMVVLSIYLGGLVLFPILFPYLPTKDYSTKGMFVGGLISIPLIAVALCKWKGIDTIDLVAYEISIVLYSLAFTGYLGLNWTGATPYPSRSSVRREIFRYIPVMALFAIVATVLTLLAALFRSGGW